MAHVAPNARARVPNFASGFSKNERAPFPAFVFSFAFETRFAPVADARSRTTNTQGQIESVTESKRSRSAEPVAGAGTSIRKRNRARASGRARRRARHPIGAIETSYVHVPATMRRPPRRGFRSRLELTGLLFFRSRFDRRRCHDTFRETPASLRDPVMRVGGIATKVDGRRSERRRRRRRRRLFVSYESARDGGGVFISLDRDASLDARRVARSTDGSTGRSEGVRGNLRGARGRRGAFRGSSEGWVFCNWNKGFVWRARDRVPVTVSGTSETVGKSVSTAFSRRFISNEAEALVALPRRARRRPRVARDPR